MADVKYKCMTKGTYRERGEPRYSPNWIISRRGSLKFYNSYVMLGSWKFDYQQIKNPILYLTRSLLIPAKILAFDYEDKHYQFGLNPWANPLPHLPFHPKREHIKLKMSVFSIIIRIVAMACLIYWLIGLFK